jgi:hypothetical protein
VRGGSGHYGGGHYRPYRPYYYRPHYYGWGWYPYYGYYDGYYYGYYGWPGPYHRRTYVFRSTGSLRLQVEPEETEVYVDGYYAGEVDDFDGIFQRLHVRPGRHEITFKLDGYRTHRVKVYVPIDRTLRVHHHMEKGRSADATESVIGSPEQDERRDRGRLAAAEAEDAAAEEEAEDVAAEAEPAEEAKPANASAQISIDVKPADAAVYLDGKFVGTADEVDELDLAAGRHRLEVVRPGHVTFVKELEVPKEGKQELELQIVLEKTVSS